MDNIVLKLIVSYDEDPISIPVVLLSLILRILFIINIHWCLIKTIVISSFYDGHGSYIKCVFIKC